MSVFKALFMMMCFISFTACEQEDSNLNGNPSVSTYIGSLKSGGYTEIALPAFSHKDIPALLQYRSDNQLIRDFPRNPISSSYQPTCKLGIYILWTIESIRAKATNSKYVVMGFPSQNAHLEWKNPEEAGLPPQDLAHEVAAKAYYDWWENNSQKDFDAFKNLDPLLPTDYKWH